MLRPFASGCVSLTCVRDPCLLRGDCSIDGSCCFDCTRMTWTHRAGALMSSQWAESLADLNALCSQLHSQVASLSRPTPRRVGRIRKVEQLFHSSPVSKPEPDSELGAMSACPWGDLRVRLGGGQSRRKVETSSSCLWRHFTDHYRCEPLGWGWHFVLDSVSARSAVLPCCLPARNGR